MHSKCSIDQTTPNNSRSFILLHTSNLLRNRKTELLLHYCTNVSYPFKIFLWKNHSVSCLAKWCLMQILFIKFLFLFFVYSHRIVICSFAHYQNIVRIRNGIFLSFRCVINGFLKFCGRILWV